MVIEVELLWSSGWNLCVIPSVVDKSKCVIMCRSIWSAVYANIIVHIISGSFIWNPFLYQKFFLFFETHFFLYHYLEAYKFSWYLETFFSFQLLISAFEIFAVKRSLYFIMLDCSIDCNHSSINLLREHEWMMYERIVNSEIMILLFTKQGITFIFHMTSFFSFFLFYTWPSFPFPCFVNRKMQKKKKKK